MSNVSTPNIATLCWPWEGQDCHYYQIANYLLASGQVIVLPIKVGDIVYRVWDTYMEKPEISVNRIKDMEMLFEWLPLFGKRVFLTSAEAEAKLKEVQDDRQRKTD